MISSKAYILVETKKNFYYFWHFQNPSQMGFALSKTTFNRNVFSKIFDFRALGVHKLFIRDKHIFVTRSYLLRKSAKEKCPIDISFFVPDGQVFFTN